MQAMAASWFDSMAWAYFAADEYEQAVRWAQCVLELDPNRHAEAFAQQLVASGLAHLDRPVLAKAALRAALEAWLTPLEPECDLVPLFLSGDESLRDRYFEELRKAGLDL